MATYSDEHIEHYADRYIAMQLRARGVSLEQYLRDPARYEHMALEPLPLLPAQRAVQARLDAQAERLEAEVDHLPRRDGWVIEPLHHHAYAVARHPERRRPPR